MTPQLSTGIDIVSIERFQKIIENKGDAFISRVFTEYEQSYCRSKANPALYFAARFAAKEAFIKAVGGEAKKISLKDIEVTHAEDGRPTIHFDLKKFKCNYNEISLSISHEKEFAVAIVIVS